MIASKNINFLKDSVFSYVLKNTRIFSEFVDRLIADKTQLDQFSDKQCLSILESLSEELIANYENNQEIRLSRFFVSLAKHNRNQAFLDGVEYVFKNVIKTDRDYFHIFKECGYRKETYSFFSLVVQVGNVHLTNIMLEQLTDIDEDVHNITEGLLLAHNAKYKCSNAAFENKEEDAGSIIWFMDRVLDSGQVSLFNCVPVQELINKNYYAIFYCHSRVNVSNSRTKMLFSDYMVDKNSPLSDDELCMAAQVFIQFLDVLNRYYWAKDNAFESRCNRETFIKHSQQVRAKLSEIKTGQPEVILLLRQDVMARSISSFMGQRYSHSSYCNAYTDSSKKTLISAIKYYNSRNQDPFFPHDKGSDITKLKVTCDTRKFNFIYELYCKEHSAGQYVGELRTNEQVNFLADSFDVSVIDLMSLLPDTATSTTKRVLTNALSKNL